MPTSDFNAMPPVHPNCKCEIIDGIWTLGESESGPCDICEQMAVMYNMGTRSDRLDKIVTLMDKHSPENWLGYRRATYKGTIQDVLEDQHADVSIISTDTLDGHNTIMDPDGMDWSEYLGPIGAPVMLSHRSMKIGRCAWVKPYVMNGVRGFLAKTIYDDSKFGNMVYDAVKQGEIEGKSIGFVPVEIREPSQSELLKNPKLKEVISKCMIYEYSSVLKPSNPDTKVVIREQEPEPQEPTQQIMTIEDCEKLILSKISIDGITRKAINRAMGRR